MQPCSVTSGRCVKPRLYARRQNRSMWWGSSPISSWSARSSIAVAITCGSERGGVRLAVADDAVVGRELHEHEVLAAERRWWIAHHEGLDVGDPHGQPPPWSNTITLRSAAPDRTSSMASLISSSVNVPADEPVELQSAVVVRATRVVGCRGRSPTFPSSTRGCVGSGRPTRRGRTGRPHPWPACRPPRSPPSCRRAVRRSPALPAHPVATNT